MPPTTGSQTRRGHVGGRDLPMAILVGVLLAAVVVGALLWRAEAFVAVVLLFVVTAHLDAARVLRASARPRLLLLPLLISAPVFVLGTAVAGATGQALATFVLFAVSVGAALASGERDRVTRRIAETLFFGVWVGLCASYAVLLRLADDGAVLVLAVIIAVALADIGGYAAGVPFGRHKLAPRLSPNKSWEGLAGGLGLTAVVSAVLLPTLGAVFSAGTALAFAVVCGLAGFAGDLGESMLKRDLGVKDLGALLPGHGGVLDRVDGVLFAMPLAYYASVLLH